MAASPSNLFQCSSASSFDDDKKSQKKHIVSSFYQATASDDIHEYPPPPLWVQFFASCVFTMVTGYIIWVALCLVLFSDLKKGLLPFRDILGIFLSLLSAFVTTHCWIKVFIRYRMAKAGLQ